MMMKTTFAAVAAAVLTAGAAGAASLSVVGGTAQAIRPAGSGALTMSLIGTPVYESLQGGVGDAGDPMTTYNSGSKSAANGLFIDGFATISFTFLGSEAGFENTGLVFGGEFVNNKADAPGFVTGPFAVSAGAIDFSFVSRGASRLDNAGTADAGTRLGLSETFNGGRSVLAFFDDPTADIDFDDLAVRIDIVSEIPIPAAGWMFLTALAGVGVLSRKRKLA